MVRTREVYRLEKLAVVVTLPRWLPVLQVFSYSHLLMNPPNTDHRSLPKLENIRRVQCLACSQITCPETQFPSFSSQTFGAWYSVLWEEAFLGSAGTSTESFLLPNEHQWHLCSCESQTWRAPVNRNHLQWAAPLQKKLTHVLCWHSCTLLAPWVNFLELDPLAWVKA